MLQLKRALERAEVELKMRPTSEMTLGELQPWLQLTYEIETRHHDMKRDAAEKQLQLAKEMVRLSS